MGKTALGRGSKGRPDPVDDLVARLAEAERPADLVRETAPLDLLLAFGSADDEQRCELLRLASGEQVNLLIDTRCWRFDRLDLDALSQLFALLALSEVDSADLVLDRLGDELRTLILGQNVRVHVREDKNEPIPASQGSELIPCPDGTYFLELTDPDSVSSFQRALFSAMFFRPFERYQADLESLRHELPSVLEEQALRWRRGRLADLGFAAREEALALFVPRSADQVRRMVGAAGIAPGAVDSGVALPVVLSGELQGNQFLDQAIAALRTAGQPDTDRAAVNLAVELALMSNRVFAAQGTDLADPQQIAADFRLCRDLVALGLAETARGDLTEAARLLGAALPGLFFQVGLGLIFPLRRRARLLFAGKKLGSWSSPGPLFDPPYRVALICLTKEVPQRVPLLEEKSIALDLPDPLFADLAPFSAPEQVSFWQGLLGEAEILPELLVSTLGWSGDPPSAPASSLVLTAMANAAAGRDPLAQAVSRAEARSFAEQALAISEDQLAADALALFLGYPGEKGASLSALEQDQDPWRRLVLRLVLLGRARLGGDLPERALLVDEAGPG